MIKNDFYEIMTSNIKYYISLSHCLIALIWVWNVIGLGEFHLASNILARIHDCLSIWHALVSHISLASRKNAWLVRCHVVWNISFCTLFAFPFMLQLIFLLLAIWTFHKCIFQSWHLRCLKQSRIQMVDFFEFTYFRQSAVSISFQNANPVIVSWLQLQLAV